MMFLRILKQKKAMSVFAVIFLKMVNRYVLIEKDALLQILNSPKVFFQHVKAFSLGIPNMMMCIWTVLTTQASSLVQFCRISQILVNISLMITIFGEKRGGLLSLDTRQAGDEQSIEILYFYHILLSY